MQERERETARASARDRQSVYKGKGEYRCKRLRQHVQVQEIVNACTRERESIHVGARE